MDNFSVDFLQEKIPYYKELCEIEKELNIKIYLVGGAVRDLLLKKDITDIDIISENIDYEILAKSLSKKIKVYAVPFKDNFRLMQKDTVIDVSKLRGSSLQEDLNLRDFTINNMALSLSGEIIGSRKDLDENIIRMVYDETFDADPLRIIRGFRFVSKFGFYMDEITLEKIIEKKILLRQVARERVQEEIRKLFKGHFLERAVDMLYENKILSDMLEMDKVDNLSLIKGVKVTEHFPLLLSLWLRDINFIKYLGIPNSEYKEVAVYQSLDYSYLKSLELRDLQQFVFNRHQLIRNIAVYVHIKFLDEHLSSKLINIYNVLDFQNSRKINGNILISLGFKPSAMFSDILQEVSFMLAVNELSECNMQEYIINKWGKYI